MEQKEFDLSAMTQYTGTKTIKAMPMQQTDACVYLGRKLVTEEEDGYLVVYEDGYKSWSPKSVFEKAYKPSNDFIDRMTIEHDDLRTRIVNLNNFRLSEDYRRISPAEQLMLDDQCEDMKSYYDDLAKRVDYYKRKLKEKSNTDGTNS